MTDLLKSVIVNLWFNTFHDQSQDKLNLEVSPRVYSKWLAQQVPLWRSAVEDLQLPVSMFPNTDESVKRKLQKATQEDEKANLSSQFTLPEWSTSVLGLLFLLCRWSSTLRGNSSKSATMLLKGLIASTVPTDKLVWHWSKDFTAGKAYPTTLENDMVQIPVQNHKVMIEGLAKHCPLIGKRLRRTPGGAKFFVLLCHMCMYLL